MIDTYQEWFQSGFKYGLIEATRRHSFAEQGWKPKINKKGNIEKIPYSKKDCVNSINLEIQEIEDKEQ